MGEKRTDERLDYLSGKVDGLERRMDLRFDAVDRRLEAIDRRFDSLRRVMIQTMVTGFVAIAGLTVSQH